MLGTRYENYDDIKSGLPFVLNTNVIRDRLNYSTEKNWHDNLELQFCQDGHGSVLLDGIRYSFLQGSIACANSNAIHYTGTDDKLVYDALIISNAFCKQMDIDPHIVRFEPIFRDQSVWDAFAELKEIYLDDSARHRTARLSKLLLEILIGILTDHVCSRNEICIRTADNERVKRALVYLRDNFSQKISLEDISRSVLCDKYTLCRDFKKYTGQTVFENLNRYRCIKAAELLNDGKSVAEAALLCGFESFSFFTKTFKKYMGSLPSEYKKRQSKR